MGFVCWVCMNLASRPLVSELTLALAGALFCEVDLTDPEARILLTLAVGALLWVWSLFVTLRQICFAVLSCVKSVLLTPRHEFCLPLLWVLSAV